MDVRLHEPTFGEDEIAAVVDVMRSGRVTQGEKVREFEQAFELLYPGWDAVMCNSGSSANLLSVAALCSQHRPDGLRRGDGVIVPALAWSTTVWPLVQHGLIPVIVDIDPETLNIDVEQAKEAIGPRVKAVMPVHVYGNPCDMTELWDICAEHKLSLIEDCCEALGAEINGRPVGSFGCFATFSFYFSHHITTVEGGMVLTIDRQDADWLRSLRSHGWLRDGTYVLPAQYPADDRHFDPRFTFIDAGYNLRATELQAAMGLAQLPKLPGFVKARTQAASMLRAIGARYPRWLRLQREHGRSSWFGFTVVVEPDAPFTAAEIRDHLEDAGIETRAILCGNIAEQPAMKLYPHTIVGRLEHASEVMGRGFSIGCHQAMDSDACAHVGRALDDFMTARGCN